MQAKLSVLKLGRHGAALRAAEAGLDRIQDYRCYDGVPMQAPTSVPRLVELLEVPLPLLRAHLEHLQKEGHDKGREVWCPLNLPSKQPAEALPSLCLLFENPHRRPNVLTQS